MQDIKAASWTNDSYQWTGYTNGTRSYTANGLNQYATAAGSTLSYDANGNLGGDGVWTYAYLCPLGYNLDNQLTAANKTGSANSLAYDGAGRLSQTTLAGVVTNLSYDDSNLVAEYNSTGALLRRYVHGPGVDEPLVWYEGAVTTNKTWLYSDHQGSIVATANSAGTSTATLSYGPYGEPNATTGVRFRYTGQQLLGPLNLYYYKARMYSPAIGRFLQTDPIGYGDGLNWYAYVGNNPFNLRDPSGLAMVSLGNAAQTGLNFISPGGQSFTNAYANYKAGNYSQTGLWALQGTLEFAAAGVTLGTSQYGSSVISNYSKLNAVADAALASGKSSGAAAELRVGNQTFTGISGEIVPSNPQVTGALMGTQAAERAPWHGACAEIACLDKALNAGVDPRGGTIQAVNIGISGAGHNTPKVICSSCSDILDFFGVNH